MVQSLVYYWCSQHTWAAPAVGGGDPEPASLLGLVASPSRLDVDPAEAEDRSLTLSYDIVRGKPRLPCNLSLYLEGYLLQHYMSLCPTAEEDIAVCINTFLGMFVTFITTYLNGTGQRGLLGFLSATGRVFGS
ncbi:hypothetical protein Y1Q_0001825 [Alligator mississippiensis]|uniref:Uncharacterized protein n=1 Tax=Alligator mississippiensis TaxID=8496 RepID=A0A151ML10_ALLMI|nr:hypothetical protein Y1Q_0001825 [Alligator mississippiensis]